MKLIGVICSDLGLECYQLYLVLRQHRYLMLLGTYKYGGAVYKSLHSPSGSSMQKCREVATKALKVNESLCTHTKCTFGGVWNGGGGDGQKNLFVASFFFDRAAEVCHFLGK